MGYELWVSKNTGQKRNGTGFVDFKKMFTDTLSAKFISEKLECCRSTDVAQYVKEKLEHLEFDSAGVVNEDEVTVGYVITNELGDGQIYDYVRKFDFDRVISDSTPLSEIINVFKGSDFVYVNYIDQVTGIVTKADLNKPPVRVYLFGVLSLFEMHLSYWVGKVFEEKAWQKLIDKKRLESAIRVYESRRSDNMNQNITLLECLQLCDKRDILLRSEYFLELIDMSRKNFRKFMRSIEAIRNNLAHSQNSIIDSIEFNVMGTVISDCEKFLLRSDNAALSAANKN